MKNFLLVSVFVGALAGAGWAQSPVNLGFKGLFNYSNLVSGDQRIAPSGFLGVGIGVFGRVKLGNGTFLQPEVYYLTKGADLTYNLGGRTTSGRVRLAALDVPLLLGVKVIDLKAFNLRLLAGPVATVVLEERQNVLQSLFSPVNVGGQLGLGFDVANVTVDVRYETGLLRFNTPYDQRNQSFQLALGIKLL